MSHASSPDVRQLRRVSGAACPLSEEQAHALLDGELDAEREGTLREHLGQCRECRERVGRLRRFLALLRRQRRQSPHAPASLLARVRALRLPPPTGPADRPPDQPA